jgi:hypothetical protein
MLSKSYWIYQDKRKFIIAEVYDNPMSDEIRIKERFEII